MVDSYKLLHQRLRESCDELFLSLGRNVTLMNVTQTQPAGDRRQIASVIGFSGWQIKGSLTVSSTGEFFAETRPVAGGGANPAPEVLADWAGELTNQLLGRLKNKMLAHGLDFQVGIPAMLFGECFVEVNQARPGFASLLFRTGSHHVRVSFTGELKPGVELLEEPEGRVAYPAGKTLLL
jgi:chemotaxis protein CheX